MTIEGILTVPAHISILYGLRRLKHCGPPTSDFLLTSLLSFGRCQEEIDTQSPTLTSIALFLTHITPPGPGKRAITNFSILIGSVTHHMNFSFLNAVSQVTPTYMTFYLDPHPALSDSLANGLFSVSFHCAQQPVSI
jgi:hypothetical protein